MKESGFVNAQVALVSRGLCSQSISLKIFGLFNSMTFPHPAFISQLSQRRPYQF